MKGWPVRMGAALLGMMACLQAGAQVDLTPFLKKDTIDALKISPTGEYYAMAVPQEDRTVLTVVRRSDMKVTAKVGGIRHSVVDDFWWVNNERLVVSMAEKYGSEDQPHPTGELHAINADGSQARMLFARYGVQGDGDIPEAAFLEDTLRNDDRNVLVSVMPVNSKNPLTRVEKLDVYTRRRSTVVTAPVRRASFATDAAGVVRFAQGADLENNSKLYYRAGDGAEWQLLNDQAVTHRSEWPLGLSEDGTRAYLQVEKDEGPDAIVSMELASGTRIEKLRDATVDPYGAIYNRDDWSPVGAFFMHEKMQARFFDPASPTAKLYRQLEKAFAGLSVHVTSGTSDGKLLVLRAWSDTNPGDYFLFNSVARSADLIYSQRDWFDPAEMAPTRAITLKARDGLELHGYLTVPKGEAQNLPMVVVPHGGPYTVFDTWGFDNEAQMLSAAGYAVLRINFRGSGNYGMRFLHAGARQWGLKMQDDVTDATRWAIAQKIADPARICIYGASYGGYAALMGVNREPDLYRCAVGYVGVYDLEMMHKVESRESKWMRNWTADWLGAREGLAAVSPNRSASRIKVPVFLAAGGEDDTAPIAHSKRMEKALKEAGVPVETLYYGTEGHGFYTEPHRREFYTKLLDFLSRNIGGAKAK